MARETRPLTEEQQRLVSDNYEMVGRAVSVFCRKGLGYGVAYDELESEALLAICEAAQGFDPRRGVDFRVYGFSAIFGALRAFSCAERRKNLGAVSLDDPAVAAEADHCNQVDGREQAATGDDVRMFRRAVGALTPDEVRVLAGRSVGVTTDDMAERMGVGRVTILRRSARGMQKIRNFFDTATPKFGNTCMRGIDSGGSTGTSENPL